MIETNAKRFNKTRQFLNGIKQADVFATAAQTSYFILLSLFPLIVFLLTLIGYLPISEDNFYDFLVYYTPIEITEYIHTSIAGLVGNKNSGLLSLSIVGTLWSASNGINAITKSLNRAYEVKENRSYLWAKIISLGLTIGIILVVVIALLLPIFGKMIGESIFSFIGLPKGFLGIWNILRWVISTFIFFSVLSFIYILAPNKKVNWKSVLIGALFSTLFLQIVSYIFSFYVSKVGHYSTTYGSLGTVIVLMVWLYLSAIIILTGGVVNVYIRNQRNQSITK